MSSSKDFLTAKFRCLSRGVSSSPASTSTSAPPEYQSWGESNGEPPATENGSYFAMQDVADNSRLSTVPNGCSNLTVYSRGGQHNNNKDKLLGSLPSFNPSKLRKRLTFVLWVTAAVVALRCVFALPSLIGGNVFDSSVTAQLMTKVSDSGAASNSDGGGERGVGFLVKGEDQREPVLLRGSLTKESLDGKNSSEDFVLGNESKANLIDLDDEDEGVDEDDNDKKDDKNGDRDGDRDGDKDGDKDDVKDKNDDDDDDDDKDKDDKEKDDKDKDKDDDKDKDNKDKDGDDEYDDDDDEDDELIIDDADEGEGGRKEDDHNDHKRMSEIMDKMDEIRRKRQNKAKQTDAAAEETLEEQQKAAKAQFEAKQKAAKKELEAKRKAEKKELEAKRKAEKKELEAKHKAAKKEFEAKQKAAAKEQLEAKQKAAAEKQQPGAKEKAAAAEQLIEAQQIAATLK